MREILFRGFHPDENGTTTITLNGKKIKGEWVFGYPIYDFGDCRAKKQGKCVCNHNGEFICFYGWLSDCHEYDEIEVLPETVCQYTGLTDKNGKRIFEGDIVQWGMEELEDSIRTAIVEINPDIHFRCAGVKGNDCAGIGFHYGNFIYKETEKYLEVIGNIYENADLLEVEE